MQREFGVPTHLVNDASAAAIGEAKYGAGRGVKHFVYVTLSTGIGAGIVIDGKLYTGQFGGAGELGHMTIQADGPPCTCGGNGCWETLASGTALAREARDRLRAGETSLMLDYADGEIDCVDAPLIHRAALAGDRLANELIVLTGYYVGIGLANIINIFNPALIVLGGGLTNIGDMLLEPAYRVAGERAYPAAFKAVRFSLAELGDEVGVRGAVAYALARADA